jgi:hypothetical protein
MLEYYSQRASDGGLIVSEATSISVAGGGWFAAPGLYSEEQVSGWRRITVIVLVNHVIVVGKLLIERWARSEVRRIAGLALSFRSDIDSHTQGYKTEGLFCRACAENREVKETGVP